MKRVMFPYAIWFFLFFVTTEGYGLRMESWGGASAGLNIGWFTFLQLSLNLLALVMLPKGFKSLLNGYRIHIGKAVFILAFVTPFYLFLLTFIKGAFGESLQLNEIVQNIMSMKSMLLFFLFANLISQPNGMKIAWDMLAFNALVAALVIILIIGLQLETAVVSVSTSEDVTRFFRAIFPTSLLVASGWLLFWSRYLARGGVAPLLASMICLFSTVIQLHRNTLIAVFVVLLFVFARLLFVNLKIRFTQRLTLIVVVGTIFSVAAYYALEVSPFITMYALSAFDEFSSLSGNAGHRFLIIFNSFDFVLNSFGLGQGFYWERVEDLGEYLNASFIAGPTFDSTYANIIIVYGIPGMLLFLWIAIESFKTGNPKQSFFVSLLDKEISIFIRPFLVFCLVVGLGTDLVLFSSNAVIFAIFLLIVVQLKKRFVENSSESPM